MGDKIATKMKIAIKIRELRVKENSLINNLSESHQVVDAADLVEALIKRAALQSILDDRFMHI